MLSELLIDSLLHLSIYLFLCRQQQRGYGATAARLTPDQKVGSSNLSGLIHAVHFYQKLNQKEPPLGIEPRTFSLQD